MPSRAGLADVEQLNRATAAFADLEWRCGGGVVLDAINAQLGHGHAVLRAEATEPVRRQLLVAVSSLHRRASCAAFDVGLLDAAREHILRALELARDADEIELPACLFYSAGRMQLYHGPPDVALKLFQFGSPAAVASGIPRLRALLEINEARAYAMLGAGRQARSDCSASPDSKVGVPSIRHGPVWNVPMAGLRPVPLGCGWHRRGSCKLRATRRSEVDTGSVMSAALAELAACHLRNGDVSDGLRVGAAAVDAVAALHSRRARTRLTPLLAATRRGGTVARSLYERVAEAQRA